MSEKLTDPNMAADGSVVPDGLKDANENPWYVLATIYGEQEEGANFVQFDADLAAQNRRAWNGWFCADLSDKDREDRAQKTGLDVSELMPLSDRELADIVKEFRKRLKDEAANLPSRTEYIDFSKLYFTKSISFEKFAFEIPCRFSSAVFLSKASFRFATFTEFADFTSAMFMGKVVFNSVTFAGTVYFISATFMHFAELISVTFTHLANFSSSTFTRSANFSSVLRIGITSFKGFATFCFAMFTEDANFSSTRFTMGADFSSAKFKSKTVFKDVTFQTHVPEFHGAELYDDTVFTLPDEFRENWPPLEGENVMAADEQKRAYNRLRLFMNRSLQIDEEQFFHRMEMRCKRETEGWQYRWIYTLFEGASDYGNSVLRPLQWLFGLWFVGWVVYLHRSPIIFGEAPMGKAAAWSFANLFPLFGFQKRFFGDEDLHTAILVTGGVQTVAGFILLFLLGLGLRNRFRLR